MDRVEFYPDNQDDHVNFEAIIIKKIIKVTLSDHRDYRPILLKAIPEIITIFPVMENKFGPNTIKHNTKMFAPRMGTTCI